MLKGERLSSVDSRSRPRGWSWHCWPPALKDRLARASSSSFRTQNEALTGDAGLCTGSCLTQQPVITQA